MLVRAFVLLVVTFLASVPQLVMTDWRGTEGRRVQIALEMAESGDWMVPTVGFEPTWAKPPLHYWILATVAETCGTEAWMMRMPSVVALFGLALMAFVVLRRHYSEGAGWVAALGIICSPLVLFEWVTAEIDPLFAALTAMSIWALATGVARDRAGLVLAAGVLGGLAMLQKGPPYFVFAVGAYLVWWRRRGLCYALRYLLPLLAVPLCYYVPLWLTQVTPAEMFAVARAETVGRIAGFTLDHFLDTPSFWLRAWFVQLPLVLWCFWEWRGARDARMDAADLTLRMCSGAAVFAIVLLTFFPGRPTRYLLPNVPLFIFAVAPAVAHFARQQRQLGDFSRRVLRIVAIIGALGLIAMPFLIGRVGIAVAGVMLCAALAWLVIRTPRQLVAFVLLLPLVGSWTVGFERALTTRTGRKASAPAGILLTRELVALGAVESDVATYGHVDAKLLLNAGLLPRGDEFCRAAPQSKWLLSTVGGYFKDPLGYGDRVWICTRNGHFVLRERLPR